MKLIHRPLYLDRIKSLKGSPDIKIITGIRRSGKSKLMQAFIRHIEETEPEANIIYIDFTRLKYEHLKEYHAFNDYVEENTKHGSDKMYVQVSDNIAEPATLEREFDPLRRIKDAYPKVLLARTRHQRYDCDGIHVIDIAEWLYGREA